MKFSHTIDHDPIDSTTENIEDKNVLASDDSWILPALPTRLSRDDVHVWRLHLDQQSLNLPRFASMLSTEERAKAASFRFERHRTRFIVAHGALRVILSHYLNTEPDRLKFRYGAYGKPYLSKRFCRVQFNLAHSHELALYAFARGRNVGVDLEYVHHFHGVEKAAVSLHSKKETSMCKFLPSNEELRGYFGCWTRKEAYGKAVGTGLAMAVDQSDGLILPAEPSFKTNLDGDRRQTARWKVASFTPAPDYTAALVVEGRDWHIHCFQFLPEMAMRTRQLTHLSD